MDKVRSHGMNMVSYGMPFGFARGKLSMNKIKSIHFVGIKGVGMTPLAIIAKEAEIKVSGSDTADEFITDVVLKKAGIIPLVGFSWVGKFLGGNFLAFL